VVIGKQHNSTVLLILHGELVPFAFLSRRSDNVKLFQTGVISSNNSVSGVAKMGPSEFLFLIPIKGIVPNTQLNNTSFAVSGGYKLSKNLRPMHP
jgi:hypothetical protein